MTNEMVEMYLTSKTLAWSSSTLRSERHRLASVADALNGDPKALWKATAKLSPYSRLTTWTRVIDFVEWLIENGHMKGPNAYKTWKKENAKQFKHVYNPKLPSIAFEEAQERVASISDPALRLKAQQLLEGGLRYSESFGVVDGVVVGKGGKQRQVYVGAVENSGYSYSTFLRALRAVGLTPHALRKLCATRLAQAGLREAELCEAMGWSSFATAKVYIAPNKPALKAAFAALRTPQGGGSYEDKVGA